MRMILVTALSFPLTALAVDYTLPSDGWYQLQGGGATICQTGDVMPCDVQAGIYTLINHSTGVRDDNLQITAPTNPTQSFSLSRVSGEVFLNDIDVRPVNSLKAEAECPTGSSIAGVLSCSVEMRMQDESNPGEEISLGYLPSFFTTDENNASCRAVQTLNGSIAPMVVIEVTASCLAL